MKWLNKVIQIFKIKDLRKKIFFVLMILVIFRIAANVPVPGIDTERLSQFFANNQLFGLLNIFTGGAMSNYNAVADHDFSPAGSSLQRRRRARPAKVQSV